LGGTLWQPPGPAGQDHGEQRNAVNKRLITVQLLFFIRGAAFRLRHLPMATALALGLVHRRIGGIEQTGRVAPSSG
jgi:hypothetical protein